MSCGLNPEDFERLKSFIAACQKKPQILWLPELIFFREYIESLGGAIPKPEPAAANVPEPESKTKTDDSSTPMEDDAESEESEVELDNEGVLEPETLDPPEMGDQSREVNEDDEMAASAKRAEAQVALSEGDLDKAVDLFTEAIKLNPHSAIMYAKRANILIKQKRVKAALRDCDEALNLNPDSATAHKFRGRVERMMNRRRVIVKWEHLTEELEIKYLLDTNGCSIHHPKVGMHVMMWSPEGWNAKMGVIVKTYCDSGGIDSDGQIFSATNNFSDPSLVNALSNSQLHSVNSEEHSTSIPSNQISMQSSHLAPPSQHGVQIYPCPTEIDSLLRRNEHNVSQININASQASDLVAIGRLCSSLNCSEEAFATCIAIGCDNLICFTHFSGNPLCPNHIHTIYQDQTVNVTSFQAGNEVAENLSAAQTISPSLKKCKSKKAKIKILRNKGLEYQSEKSGKIISSKRKLRTRCNGSKCGKTLHCNSFSDLERFNILNSYYNLEKLEAQRQFILRHIDISTPKNKINVDGRKKRSIGYFLPKCNGQKKEVCRIMFLSTLNIAERQVRTVIEKVTNTGTLEPEKRGGRKQAQREKDTRLKKSVEDHLNKFPRMESHYCSSSNSHRCLPGDLSVKKMYTMYKDNTSVSEELASYSFYYRIFKNMKFKFHT